MQHSPVRGDIVRYSSVACYTGISYTIHCLALTVNPHDVSVLVLNDARDELRDLDPDRCTVIAHIALPPHNPSKTQLSLLDLPPDIQEQLKAWTE